MRSHAILGREQVLCGVTVIHDDFETCVYSQAFNKQACARIWAQACVKYAIVSFAKSYLDTPFVEK